MRADKNKPDKPDKPDVRLKVEEESDYAGGDGEFRRSKIPEER